MDDCLLRKLKEAVIRGFHTPADLKLLTHEAYEVEWNQFCDEFWARQGSGASEDAP